MTTMMTTRLIADFDNTLNDALNGAVEAEAALGRMYRAALARVAELESQLAAQGWQPVTEEPIEDEYYLTYDALSPGNEPWIVNYYSRTQGWANCCSAWLCPPPKPPRRQRRRALSRAAGVGESER